MSKDSGKSDLFGFIALIIILATVVTVLMKFWWIIVPIATVGAAGYYKMTKYREDQKRKKGLLERFDTESQRYFKASSDVEYIESFEDDDYREWKNNY